MKIIPFCPICKTAYTCTAYKNSTAHNFVSQPELKSSKLVEQIVEIIENAADDWYLAKPEENEEVAREILALVQQEVTEKAIEMLSTKPKCTEENPCGCHFGETFHADGICYCDQVKVLLSLQQEG